MFAITVFVITLMCGLAGVDPVKVMTLLIQMPLFQVFLGFSMMIILLFSIFKRVQTIKEQ